MVVMGEKGCHEQVSIGVPMGVTDYAGWSRDSVPSVKLA